MAENESSSVDVITAQLLLRQQMTPSSGVNVCEIDDFEFPPYNLVYLSTFEKPDHARMYARDYLQKNPGTQVVLLDSDGGSEPMRASESKGALRKGRSEKPRDKDGRWTKGDVNARAVVRAKSEDEALSTHGEFRPVKGFLVAERANERIIGAAYEGDIKTAVDEYRIDMAAHLARPNVFLGASHVGGALTLDNSRSFVDRRSACWFAKQNEQIRIYNVRLGIREHMLTDRGLPSKSPSSLTQATQGPGRKMFFSADVGSDRVAAIIWEHRDV